LRFFSFLERFINEKRRRIGMASMKKVCSECRAKFETSLEDLEEGDAVPCPECNLEYTVIADKKGKLKLIESKELEMEEESEDEEKSDEDEEDYDSD
jgi:DNA-directed RNA polymerase subunit RPC12/RpoP